jgi:hypothetical protein
VIQKFDARGLFPAPLLTAEQRKTAAERYIAEHAAACAAATPEERELATLEDKTRLSTSEPARYRQLRAQLHEVA